LRKEEILLGSFFHDIGKPLERCKYFVLSKEFKDVDTKYTHPKYSAQLLKSLITDNKEYKTPYYFRKNITDKVMSLSLFHHNPQDVYQRILQLADWLSSSEREEDEIVREKYYRIPLISIFSQISISNSPKKDYPHPLFPLDFDNIFPEEIISVDEIDYKNLIEIPEMENINNFEKLYYLFQKYFSFIPAQTWKSKPDISLFDHSKTTAAIAICLYEEFITRNLNEDDIEEALKNGGNSDKSTFFLINGDLSGIQEFIFNIPSKGAVKSLKGRSTYLVLLTRYIAKYILDKLELPIVNLLYSGGGNFYILAPYSKEGLLENIRRDILNLLLDAHKGSIYCAIGWLQLTPSDLIRGFSDKWQRISEKLGTLKMKKWTEIGLEDNYSKIFGPIDVGTSENKYCKICGDVSGLVTDEENVICEMCSSFKELRDRIKKAKFIVERRISKSNNLLNTYRDVFSWLGYELKFMEKFFQEDLEENQVRIYKLNDFIFQNVDGFCLGSYNLPDKEFEEIAKTSEDGREFGDSKLACLKLDIDNLGKIFIEGLGKNKSISRVSTLSRMISLYFEGYINYLIKKEGLNENLYVVFSGGDDTFIIGAWDKVFRFLKKFHEDFRRYVAYNPDITLSAAIEIFDFRYPVIRASNIIEDRLERAKTFCYKEEQTPSKCKVIIFNEVFNWDEYEYILKIWNYLVRLIQEKEESRAILQKVIASSKGFNRLIKDSLKGKMLLPKVWRLAYYLRDMENKEDREKLVKIYEDMILKNLFEGKKIRNPMIIPVAARLAELSTKKKEGKR